LEACVDVIALTLERDLDSGVPGNSGRYSAQITAMNAKKSTMMNCALHRVRNAFFLLFTLASSTFPCFSAEEVKIVTSDSISGSDFQYRVVSGDTLYKIGARFGVDPAYVAQSNGLADINRILAGELLQIDNRHVAIFEEGSIVINIPQRMLFHSDKGQQFAYPAAVGRPGWHTPTGEFRIANLDRNHTWTVPVSIQAEMAANKQQVKECVPPGPENPLGEYWIGLSAPGYGIHATNQPSSIHAFQTHGCIRLHPDDAAELFSRASIGNPVRIVYFRALLARISGRVFFELAPDVYARAPISTGEVMAEAQRAGFAAEVDWTKVSEEMSRPSGIARDVSLHSQ
jgi:L,D-transpeptidase ErfK/SrfK